MSLAPEARVLLVGGGSTDTSRDVARTSIQMWKRILALQHAIAACAPFSVIAAAHGHIGLGVDVISACDLRYSASNSVFSLSRWVGSLSTFLLALSCS